MEIKDTLLIPKTKYSMKGNLVNKEPKLQEEWEKINIYQQVTEKNKGRAGFFLHDGPPYANGDLHLGHAVNKILKDFIVRSKSMQGIYTPVIFGWDTHGLPIENALLKNKKIKINELAVSEFRDKCKEYALGQVAGQKEQFFKLGLLADKNLTYKTLDKSYEAEQIRIFAKMVQKNLIFKDVQPVYWSPSSTTALAEAEIEYKDKESQAIFVKFAIISDKFKEYGAVIWTTTPWTIPANKGIAVHKDLEYSLINTTKGKFIIAKNLVDNVLTKLDASLISVDKIVSGAELEGIKIEHPLSKDIYKVMLGDHVTSDSGTGLVHTAPAHGEDDFKLGKEYNLEIKSIVDAIGKMINTNKYDGEFYTKAQEQIIEDLKKEDALLDLEVIRHSYPHDWRTKKPLIFRTTPQWFASIELVKKEIIEEIKHVEWIPNWGEKRLTNMVQDRKDWCISRQRKWGVPIPIIYDEADQPIFDDLIFEHVATLFEKYGSNIWFEKDAVELLPPGYTNSASPNGIFKKETDILDVWFDSGSSYSGVMKRRLNQYPADLYLEGSDQYRGWFNSSITLGTISEGKAPYKTVVTHGFTLDSKGNKMSKSLGNTISPKQIYQKYGSDILRLWAASIDYQSDFRVSDEIIKQISEIYRRLRNAFRFILGNLADGEDFIENKSVNYNNLSIIDQYMLIKVDQINKEVIQNYNSYEFKKVLDTINNFITVELSSFYFDYIKDILYINEKDDLKRKAVQTVLFQIFKTFVKLLSPIIPHTTYETWNYLFPGNLFLEEFEEFYNYKNTEEILAKVSKILKLRDDVNKSLEVKREQKEIGKSLEAELDINIKNEEYKFLESLEDLEIYLIVSKINFTDKIEKSTDYENFDINIKKYSDHSCNRCWRFFKKEELNELGVCNRCSTIMKDLEFYEK